MRKGFCFILITIACTFILTACGENGEKSAIDTNEKNVSENEYVEETTFELEGPVKMMNFNLNETGDILYWGENDGGLGDDLRRNVWVDGEVRPLNIDVFNQFSFLTEAGTIITKINNPKAPEGERYSIIEYDPTTEEAKEYPTKDGFDDILLPDPGTYLDEQKMYIHTDTNPEQDKESNTYIWDVKKNEFNVLSFIDDIKKEVEEITPYVHLYLNDDASIVYGTVSEEGIYSHDVAAGTTKKLLSTEQILPQSGVSPVLTKDGANLIYGEVDPDASEIIYRYQALDVETGETIGIGDGKHVLTLSDGNAVIILDEKVMHFDFETEELQTIHTIELEENQELNNVTVSADGSTIAYGYETKGEDEEEDTYEMTILRNG